MQKTADVIVIGGGVMGASIAYHLARQGVGQVLVLEKNTVCSGNTRKSGALVRMHYTYAPEARLAVASLPVFQNWADVVGGDCGFTETGFLMLVGPRDVDKLHRNIRMLKACGVTTEVLGPDDIRRLQPCARIDDVGAAAYEPHAGYANPVATTHAFMDAARRLGVEVEEGVAVQGLLTSGAAVAGVRTSSGDVSAPSVVCAAGPWSQYLSDLPITPMRAQIAFLHRGDRFAADPALRQQMTYIDAVGGTYSRPHGNDESMVGIGAWGETVVDNPDVYPEANDPDYVPEVRRRLRTRLPALAEAPYLRGHAGLYDVTPDTRCILDQHVGVTGYFVAAGFSGTGFKLSPAVGLAMAQMVSGAPPTLDVLPFRLARFQEGVEAADADAEYELPADFGHRF